MLHYPVKQSGQNRYFIVFQSVFFVYSFTPAAFRLAIPEEYAEASLVSVALSQSALYLIVWSLLLPAVVSIYIAATTSYNGARFLWISRVVAKLDTFVDALLACVMQFKFPLGDLNLAVKVAVALIMFFEFLFLHVLQAEVVSFAQETRIPASGCRYKFCGHIGPVEALGIGGRVDIFHEPHVWNLSAAEPTKSLRDCDGGVKQIAFYPYSIGEKTLFLYLFLGRGFCGRRDLIDIKANSYKGRGLQIEEKLPVGRQSVELCTVRNIPWLQRRLLENSLLSFSFYEKDGGLSHQIRAEKAFWSRNDSFIRNARNFLERNLTFQKQLYNDFNMWEYDKDRSLTLSGLWGSFTFIMFLILLSVFAFLLENSKHVRALLLRRPSMPQNTTSTTLCRVKSLGIRSAEEIHSARIFLRETRWRESTSLNCTLLRQVQSGKHSRVAWTKSSNFSTPFRLPKSARGAEEAKACAFERASPPKLLETNTRPSSSEVEV